MKSLMFLVLATLPAASAEARPYRARVAAMAATITMVEPGQAVLVYEQRPILPRPILPLPVYRESPAVIVPAPVIVPLGTRPAIRSTQPRKYCDPVTGRCYYR